MMTLETLGFPAGSRLANPEMLALLLVVALLVLLHWRRGKRKAVAVVRYSVVFEAGRVRPSIWARLRALPDILGRIALILLVIAMARPQTVRYERLEEVLSFGADIMLVMDTSGSMEALDFQPSNRLHVAKEVVGNFIKGRKGDQIGMVAFAGQAATLCPLTTNNDYLDKQIEALDFGLFEDGTAIGTALSTALNRLTASKAKSKVIILLTDGVNNRGEVAPMDAAKIAKDMGVRVYTVGIGSEGEVPFPNKPPYYGRSLQVGLDEELLERIAKTTGAVYRRAFDPRSLSAVYEEINRLEKTEVKARIYSYPIETEYFPWFLYTALALFAAQSAMRWTRMGVLP